MRWMLWLMGGAAVMGCNGRSSSDADGTGSGSGDASADDGDSGDDGSGSSDAADGDADGGSDSNSMDDGSATTGEPPVCDPSDPDVGPAVAVSIVNDTDVPLFVTESQFCAYGPPFSILRDGAPVQWLVEDCVTCAGVTTGACGCSGACTQDSVIRIDAGGRWQGTWTGAEAMPVQLAAECTDEFCGDQCTALVQAPDDDYVARAVASDTVACDQPTCECGGDPNPDGWCSIGGTRSGTESMVDAAFVYTDSTSVEIVFG